jgi:hypothetical protein
MNSIKTKLIYALIGFCMVFGFSISVHNYILYKSHENALDGFMPIALNSDEIKVTPKVVMAKIETDELVIRSVIELHESLRERALFHSKLFGVIFIFLTVLFYLLEKYVLPISQHNKSFKQDK